MGSLGALELVPKLGICNLGLKSIMVVSYGGLLGWDRVVEVVKGSRESKYTWKCRELGANL